MLAVALLPGQLDPPARDAQRAPDVVGDDLGELVEPLVLALEFPLSPFAFPDVASDTDEPDEVGLGRAQSSPGELVGDPIALGREEFGLDDSSPAVSVSSIALPTRSRSSSGKNSVARMSAISSSV